MAYNNYFPMGYAPQYYTPQVGTQMSSPQQSNNFQSGNSSSGIIWVQGEAGAKSYLVAPNTTVQLWDSEAQVIYLKSADASGMPSMKIIDYTIRNSAQSAPQSQQSESITYVTKTEFDAFKQEVRKAMGGKQDEPTVPANE